MSESKRPLMSLRGLFGGLVSVVAEVAVVAGLLLVAFGLSAVILALI